MKTKYKLFNPGSFVTVLESVNLLRLNLASTAKQRLCTKYYNMKKVAIGFSNRKKRKLIASFYLKQKPIYFKNCKTAKPLIFKIHLTPL